MDPNNFDYADNADLHNSRPTYPNWITDDNGPFVGTGAKEKGMLWHKKRTKFCWLGMAQWHRPWKAFGQAALCTLVPGSAE